MLLGASSFAATMGELESHVHSVELYIPKLGVYEGNQLQQDRLECILDELSTCDLTTSIHAPYYADVDTYPKGLVLDTADMGRSHFRLMEESIELASLLGSAAVVIHPGRIQQDREHSFRKMVENLRRLAAFASERDVMLGLENKEGTDPGNLCCNAGELLKAVHEVDSPHLGITFDVGHANLTMRGDPVSLRHFAKSIADEVVHVHLHDNNGQWTSDYSGDVHMAPGHGSVDYSVLSELVGYDGIYNLEVFSLDDVITGKKQIQEIFGRGSSLEDFRNVKP
ncbi:MAG: sugar phosphate isomerase/epimerase family protein [Euryarchaeota archaeon]|nr:sugar phosphate isomerase/epimerase family protein [Euryarchaeota archaeon]